jgi:xanthine/uracil permease
VIFLGLVLAGAALALCAGVALDNGSPAQLNTFGHTVPGVTTEWQVFLAGVIVAVLLMAGLTAVFFGIGRAIRRREERRQIREEAEESISALQLQKRQLQRELALARAGTEPAPQAAAR